MEYIWNFKYIKQYAIITFSKEEKTSNYSYKKFFFKKKFISRNKTIISLFQFFILISILFLANSQSQCNIANNNRKLAFSNEITIKIMGDQKKNILYNAFTPQPQQIYANGVITSINGENEIQSLQNGENVIKMIWNSQIENCETMFMDLDNIIEIDLSNFDSSNVSSMTKMFSGCESLLSINFSGINTKKVRTMNFMFYNCKSLISLDLSDLDTSKVLSMLRMFQNCYSLKSIDLSSFNTSSTTIMTYMFQDCHELSYLDISNFDTSKVMMMLGMFINCKKLSYLNLSKWDLSSILSINNLFINCSNLEFIDFTNFKETTMVDKDSILDGLPDNFSYCINNNENMPLITEAINNKNCTINDCENTWKNKQKKIISEKNKCVYECIDYESYSYTFKNKCYNKCPEGTYLSNEEEKLCSIKCTEELPFEKNEECFSECNAKDFLSEICTINNKTIQAKESMINKITSAITDGSIDTMLSNVINGEKKDLIIKDTNEIYQITTSYNQNNNIYNNGETTLKLGECESILKEEYGIEDTLIIYKMDYFLDGFLIPITEFEIFGPTNKEKLDLTKCLDKTINIYIPVSIDEENIYKYDPNSDYYKDKCFPSLTECGDDNLLTERKNEFNNNYLSLCEANCIYKGYDTNSNKATCECNIKTDFMNLSDIINKKSELLFKIIDEEIEIIPTSNIDITSTINSDSNTDSIVSSNVNIDTDTETNSNTNENAESESDSNENTNTELDSNVNIDTDTETNSNTNENTDGESDSNANTVTELDSNVNINVDTESNSVTDRDINLDTESDSNVNSDLNSNIIAIKECLFLEKTSKECEDIAQFEELINEKYIPLNNKKTIDKVFELYSEDLKNNKNSKRSEIIEGDKITFQITTTEEQNFNIQNNLYKNISSIDLDECEEIIREKYDIEEPLIIMKVDIKRNDTLSTQVEYEVFNPINLEKINLSICENANVNIYPPLDLDPNIIRLAKQLKEQGYDLFDSSDDFFNDICSPYNSFNRTDVILNDRKNDFYISNITLCEDTCQYEEFDLELLKPKCKCNAKTERKTESQVKFKPNEIIENFYKVEKYANVKVAVCYQKVFDLNRLKKNYGSYIILGIVILFIILMAINFLKLKKNLLYIIQIIIQKNNLLKMRLNQLENKGNDENQAFNLNFKTTNKKFKEDENSTTNLNSNKMRKKNQHKNSKIKNADNSNEKLKMIDKIRNKIKKNNKNKVNNPKKKKNLLSIKLNNNDFGSQSYNKKLIDKKFIDKRKNKINIFNVKGIFIASNQLKHAKLDTQGKINKNNKNKKSDKDTELIDKIIKYIPKGERSKYFIDDELNDLDYNYAVKIDFRNYFQFYFSLLKQTHLIIFTFFVRNDYNIFLLKLAMFLISFALFFFMNALFFNDDSMHKIYEDEGKYDLLYQIPQTLYSTIVSQVISSLLEMLTLSQDDILNIKNEGKKIREKATDLIKCIKIKCTILLAIGIILLFGFWYYLSAFCAVYYNTQVPLIKDTFVSFFTSMIYPFILDLLPGIFRIISLRFKNKCFYVVSKFVTKLIGIF